MTNISQSGPPPVAALLEMNVELVLGLRFTGPVMPGPRMQRGGEAAEPWPVHRNPAPSWTVFSRTESMLSGRLE